MQRKTRHSSTQDGIGALLEALREHIHSGDMELLQALLTVLSDVSSNASNVTLVVKHNGNAVVLACGLAHLKRETLLMPALQVLVNTSRSTAHVLLLSREGAVPAPPSSPTCAASRCCASR